MKDSLMPQLGICPQDVTQLSGTPRSSLLHFLIRWEGYQDVLDCLDAIGPTRLVSLYDFRAEALVGLNRPADAIAVMGERLEHKSSPTARMTLGRCYLANADPQAALAIAQEIIRVEDARSMTGAEDAPIHTWGFLGDVHLQLGDLDAAEAAYLRHQRLSPNSPAPLYGLAQVHRQRGDPVTAAAYAVRAWANEDGRFPLSIPLLRRLRDFFAQTGDQNHLVEANEQLNVRSQLELTELRVLLQIEDELKSGAGKLTVKGDHRRASDDEESFSPLEVPISSPPALPDLSAIPVSDAERAELGAAAQHYFNFSSLLQAQAEIMACARRGENVLAILPTGGGKSLCYQLPAFMDSGFTLVISPLIALMKDQVDSLPTAVRQYTLAINSSLDGYELQSAITGISQGHYKLVYAAPERLRQPPFLHALRQAGLTRLVIDEAHCISIWGHDFRPDYLTIAQVRRDLGSPPILAMTATAPPRVREDIEGRLFRDPKGVETPSGLSQIRLIVTDIYRPNLYLSVRRGNQDEKLRHLLNLCQQLDGSGIVYARTRRRCEELAELLRQQGHEADHYHAGLENRALVQDRFMSGGTRIIVATVAFGMGVDKADIRFIIHYELPDSVEAYYQEAGRAGRDGQPAHCILLYSPGDKATLTRHANENIISRDFLRSVYVAIRRRLNGRNPGTMAMDDLVRDLGSDDTTVRVALSTLEQAGLLQRHYDSPRTVSLQRLSVNRDALFDRFANAAHLRPLQTIARDYGDLVADSQIPSADLENRLLVWQSAGHLNYQANGRDCLLTLLPAPVDAPTRVESLLDQHTSIQSQRVAEIVAYARNRRCRHGYLANHLGGEPRARCIACDNCLGERILHQTNDQLPTPAEQLRLILAALNEASWGRRNLLRILRGDPAVGERGQHSSAYAQLAFRSPTALNQLTDKLVKAGYVQEVHLEHGGIALQITTDGRRALHSKESLEHWVRE